MNGRGIHRAQNNSWIENTRNKFKYLEDEAEANNGLWEESDEEFSNESEELNKRMNALSKKKGKKFYKKKRTEDNFDELLLRYKKMDDISSSENEGKDLLIQKTVDDSVESTNSSDQEKSNIVNCSELMPSPLMNIIIKVKNEETTALIDTGAATNMIQQSVVQKLNIEVMPEQRVIVGLGKREISTLGFVNFEFSFYGVSVSTTPFHVVDDTVIKVPVILGRKFCAKAGLIIDMANRRLSKYLGDSSKVDIYLHPQSDNFKVSMHEDIKVMAYESVDLNEGINKVRVIFDKETNGLRNSEDQNFYFEGKDDKENVECMNGVLSMNEEEKFVFLKVDSGKNDNKVMKGEKLGTISTIFEVNDAMKENEWSLLRLKEEIDIGSNITTEQKEKVMDILYKLKDALSKDDNDIGMMNTSPQHIVLTNKTPIWQKPRHVSPPLNEEIEKQCKELELNNIIERCYSPWSSPVVPIRKADGSLRLCVDYRKVNSVTKSEKFPMPRLTDSIYAASNINYFSKMDLTKGYYQIPIHENSREITSFSTLHNQYQFKRLSFGLKNSGIQFQRTLQEVLSKFSSKNVIIYIDDILIITETFEQHLELLEKVMTTLAQNGIKLKVTKSEFLKEKVSFLGHIISKDGIDKCPKYIEKIQNYPKPNNINQLRRFLGLSNFQRKFVHQFASIAKPLSECTSGPKRKTLVWTKEMEDSFETLKAKLLEEVRLVFPNYTDKENPLELFVDASGLGSGACLMQKQKGSYKAIAYASMSFSQTERNYSPTDRELLAMRWGIKAFRDFLFGVKFVVYSDHRPLIYLKNLSKVNARLARTLSELEEYEFEIRYRPGPQNEAADALSRIVEAVESTDLIDGNYLPKGLKIVEKIDGGGNSLFEALLVILDRANKFTGKFEGINNCQDLRTLLINHLLTNISKFNFKAGQIKTKEIRSMLIDDVMPCMEVLMAASDLFNVTIHVHHGMKYPLVYKSSKLVPEAVVIHLQCKSGIHFNPVAARSNADASVSDKLIQFVDVSTSDYSEGDSFTDDLQVMVQGYNDKCICKHKETENFCTFSSSIGGYNSCSLIDTEAEVSLISEELLVKIKSENRELILKNEGGNLFGVGNQKVNVLGVVKLNLKMFHLTKLYHLLWYKQN